MTDILLISLGIVCLIIGFVGCFVPILPGPPISYGGMLLLHVTSRVQFTARQLLVWLALTIVVQVLDYIVPLLGTKYCGGTKYGNWGCVIGTIVGLVFVPYGLVFGPFLGAVIGELAGGSTSDRALLSGVGSLLGFLFGTLVKCVLCGYFVWQFVAALFV